MSLTETMTSADAAEKACELIAAAIARAKASGSKSSLADLSEAIGFADGNKGAPMSEIRAGLRTFSFTNLVRLVHNKPRDGHAFVTVLAEYCVARMCAGAPPSRIAALDALIASVLDLAAVGCAARADNTIDDAEGRSIAGKVEAVKRCADVFVSTLSVVTAPKLSAVRT